MICSIITALAQYWRNIGAVLAENRRSTGGLSAKYWRITDAVLADYRWSTGAVRYYTIEKLIFGLRSYYSRLIVRLLEIDSNYWCSY